MCCFCTRSKCCDAHRRQTPPAKDQPNHLHDLKQLSTLAKPIRVKILNNPNFHYVYAAPLDQTHERKKNKRVQNNNEPLFNSVPPILDEKCKLCKKLIKSNQCSLTKTLSNGENGKISADKHVDTETPVSHSQHRDRLNTTTSGSTNRDHRLFKKNVNVCSYCCCCCCCCLPFDLRSVCKKSRFCLLCDSLQEKLKSFVDGRFFQRAILFAILINTLSMGVEHHLQVN